MTAQYELTLQDLRDYIDTHLDDTYIIGVCWSACKCLGASALQWKYQGKGFMFPCTNNTFFETYISIEHFPVDPKVSAILYEFDALIYLRLGESNAIDILQLYKVAHDGHHPHLAQLFASPSHLSLSQE